MTPNNFARENHGNICNVDRAPLERKLKEPGK